MKKVFDNILHFGYSAGLLFSVFFLMLALSIILGVTKTDLNLEQYGDWE